MLTDQDRHLVDRVIEGTTQGRIHWQATALRDQYTASFKGKWSLLVDKYGGEDEPEYCKLTMKDAEDREMLEVYSGQYTAVMDLYEAARREALKVDQAIADIFEELGQERPPSKSHPG